jgi:hypothetical protein
MAPKQFYDWQTAGGTDDVMRLVARMSPLSLEALSDALCFTESADSVG